MYVYCTETEVKIAFWWFVMFKKLKIAFKNAVRSGKIYFVGTSVDGHFDYNFSNFVSRLNESEWASFINKENQFRSLVSSRSLNPGDIICKGDPKLWLKLIKTLTGIFFLNGKFLVRKPDFSLWNDKNLKYCVRILKYFPRCNDVLINSNLSLID